MCFRGSSGPQKPRSIMDIGFRGNCRTWSTQRSIPEGEGGPKPCKLANLRPPEAPILGSEVYHHVHRSIPTG